MSGLLKLLEVNALIRLGNALHIKAQSSPSMVVVLWIWGDRFLNAHVDSKVRVVKAISTIRPILHLRGGI